MMRKNCPESYKEFLNSYFFKKHFGSIQKANTCSPWTPCLYQKHTIIILFIIVLKRLLLWEQWLRTTLQDNQKNYTFKENLNCQHPVISHAEYVKGGFKNVVFIQSNIISSQLIQCHYHRQMHEFLFPGYEICRKWFFLEKALKTYVAASVFHQSCRLQAKVLSKVEPNFFYKIGLMKSEHLLLFLVLKAEASELNICNIFKHWF